MFGIKLNKFANRGNKMILKFQEKDKLPNALQNTMFFKITLL